MLRERPGIVGTVADTTGPLESVPVTLTDHSGTTTRTVTDSDGGYRFARLATGTYEISVTPPDGYATPAPDTGVIVAGDDVTGQDLTLSRVGSRHRHRHRRRCTCPGRRRHRHRSYRRSAPADRRRRHLPARATAARHLPCHRPPARRLHRPGRRHPQRRPHGCRRARGGVDFTLLVTSVTTSPTPTGSSSATPSTSPTSSSAVPVGTSPTSGNPQGLSTTGGPVLGLLLAGLALLVLGAGLAIALRRGRHARRTPVRRLQPAHRVVLRRPPGA